MVRPGSGNELRQATNRSLNDWVLFWFLVSIASFYAASAYPFLAGVGVGSLLFMLPGVIEIGARIRSGEMAI